MASKQGRETTTKTTTAKYSSGGKWAGEWQQPTRTLHPIEASKGETRFSHWDMTATQRRAIAQRFTLETATKAHTGCRSHDHLSHSIAFVPSLTSGSYMTAIRADGAEVWISRAEASKVQAMIDKGESK